MGLWRWGGALRQVNGPLPLQHLDHEFLDLGPGVVQRLQAAWGGPVVLAHLAVDDPILPLHIAGAFELMQDRVQGAWR